MFTKRKGAAWPSETELNPKFQTRSSGTSSENLGEHSSRLYWRGRELYARAETGRGELSKIGFNEGNALGWTLSEKGKIYT